MTFSIVARDLDTGDMGMCVTTGVACVGALAPHVSRAAAVSTQAYVNVDLGLRILQLVESGLTVPVALDASIQVEPDADMRQVVGIDAEGNVSAHTGSKALPWRGHQIHTNFAVAGNGLKGEDVLDAMSESFKTSDGEFTSRLIDAVAAGSAGGGERDDIEEIELHVQNSASVLVASSKPRAFHNLRVDAADDAMAELRRVYDAAVASAIAMESFYEGVVELRPLFWRSVGR